MHARQSSNSISQKLHVYLRRLHLMGHTSLFELVNLQNTPISVMRATSLTSARLLIAFESQAHRLSGQVGENVGLSADI